MLRFPLYFGRRSNPIFDLHLLTPVMSCVRCSHSVFKDMDMPLFLFFPTRLVYLLCMFKCSVALCSTLQNDVNNIGYWIGRFGKQNECFTKINYTCKNVHVHVMHQLFISTAPKRPGNSDAFNFSIFKPR